MGNGEWSSFWPEYKEDPTMTPSINTLSFLLNLYFLSTTSSLCHSCPVNADPVLMQQSTIN